MFIGLLTALSLCQIDTTPTITELRVQQVDKYADQLRVGMFYHPMNESSAAKSPYFPTASYLRLAEWLQTMPERERVAWLRAAARSHRLKETAVLLSRILIVARSNSRLRTIYSYIGVHAAGKPEAEFPDSPLELFEGVPFYVAGGGAGTGVPEDARKYVAYLLANGEWRPIKFKSLSSDEIRLVAARYLESLTEAGLKVSNRFETMIRQQASLPLARIDAERGNE